MTQGNFAPPASLLATSGPPLGPKPRPAAQQETNVYLAAASAQTVIAATSSPGTVITGALLTLPLGKWLIHGIWYFEVTTAGVGIVIGQFLANTVAFGGRSVMNEAAVEGTHPAQATLNVTVPDTIVQLAAFKTINAGAVRIPNASHTTITALRVASS